MTGRIHSIETFGTVDGPGIRFVVFLQGCRWRCRYCHNPDTWALDGGTEWTAEALAATALRYRAWFDASGGGVTVSGGEPLLQAAFVAAFFERLRAEGVHTCLDTNGDWPQGVTDTTPPLPQPAISPPAAPDTAPATPAQPLLERLLDATDLVLLDVKETDPDGHRALTGADPSGMQAFAGLLARRGMPVIFRHVLVPGLTDAPDQIAAVRQFAALHASSPEIQWLPYHCMGIYKWRELGLPYPLEGVPAHSGPLPDDPRESCGN